MPNPIITQACTDARGRGLSVDQATCEAHAQDTALCEQSAADAITDNDASGLTSCLSSGRAKAAFAKLQSGGGGSGSRHPLATIKNDIARAGGSKGLPITVDSTNQNVVRSILNTLATQVSRSEFNAADADTQDWITNFLTNSGNDTGVLDSLFQAAGQNLGLITIKQPGGGGGGIGLRISLLPYSLMFQTSPAYFSDDAEGVDFGSGGGRGFALNPGGEGNALPYGLRHRLQLIEVLGRVKTGGDFSVWVGGGLTLYPETKRDNIVFDGFTAVEKNNMKDASGEASWTESAFVISPAIVFSLFNEHLDIRAYLDIGWFWRTAHASNALDTGATGLDTETGIRTDTAFEIDGGLVVAPGIEACGRWTFVGFWTGSVCGGVNFFITRTPDKTEGNYTLTTTDNEANPYIKISPLEAQF